MDLMAQRGESEGMFFSAYCCDAGAEVLLGPDNVLDVGHGPLGLELHYRCYCGETGVLYPQRDRTPTRNCA
jgi:hypothetical protein